jgi:hypothetical protein
MEKISRKHKSEKEEKGDKQWKKVGEGREDVR